MPVWLVLGVQSRARVTWVVPFFAAADVESCAAQPVVARAAAVATESRAVVRDLMGFPRMGAAGGGGGGGSFPPPTRRVGGPSGVGAPVSRRSLAGAGLGAPPGGGANGSLVYDARQSRACGTALCRASQSA